MAYLVMANIVMAHMTSGYTAHSYGRYSDGPPALGIHCTVYRASRGVSRFEAVFLDGRIALELDIPDGHQHASGHIIVAIVANLTGHTICGCLDRPK